MRRTLNIHGVEIEATLADGMVWLEADSPALYAQKRRVLDVLAGTLGLAGGLAVPFIHRLMPDDPPTDPIDWQREPFGTRIRFVSDATRTKLIMEMSEKSFTQHLLPYSKEE